MTKTLDLFDTVRRRRATRAQVLSKVPAWHEEEVTEELSRYADPPGSGSSSLGITRHEMLLITYPAVPTSFAERTRHDYE